MADVVVLVLVLSVVVLVLVLSVVVLVLVLSVVVLVLVLSVVVLVLVLSVVVLVVLVVLVPPVPVPLPPVAVVPPISIGPPPPQPDVVKRSPRNRGNRTLSDGSKEPTSAERTPAPRPRAAQPCRRPVACLTSGMGFPRCLVTLLLGLSALTATGRAAADTAWEHLLGGPQELVEQLRFEEGAAAYERLAHEVGGDRAAPRALAAAVRLRLGLGQVEEARADARLLDGLYRDAHPDLALGTTIARAHWHARLLEWGPLCALIGEAMPVLDRRGAPDDRLQGHALLGRALERLGEHREARAQYRRVLDLAKRVPSGDPGKDAVGEARFFFADEAGRAAAAIVLPPYQGPADRKAVAAYLSGPAARWMERRYAAVEAAERAYLGVLGVEVPLPPPPPPPPPPPAPGTIGLLDSLGGDPNAPIASWGSIAEDALGQASSGPPAPRWAVAAAAGAAMGWAKLVTELRSLPVPPWDPDEALRGVYYLTLLDSPSEVQKQRAKAACEACLRIAAHYGIADEHTEACDTWLSRSYRSEHAPFEDLLPKIGATPAVGVFDPARLSP